jgi:hypothetical protein
MRGSGTSASTPLVAASFLLAREIDPTVTISEFLSAVNATGVLTEDVLASKDRIDIAGMLNYLKPTENPSTQPTLPSSDPGEIGPDDGEQSVWTKRISDTQVKFYAKYPQLGQKIQFMVQGDDGDYDEFAWIRIEADDLDANGDYIGLTNAIYYVRTVNLEPGKNRLRIYIDGEDAIGTKTYSF